LVVLAILVAGSALYHYVGGQWIGWPTIVFLAVIFKAAWCFVA
jgi:uncharacterized membrane protein YjjP (DUF1212 family)